MDRCPSGRPQGVALRGVGHVDHPHGLALLLLSLATAGPLDDYAGQKHTDRAKVTKQTCEAAYIERCQEGD